jgi:hypothetical protein
MYASDIFALCVDQMQSLPKRAGFQPMIYPMMMMVPISQQQQHQQQQQQQQQQQYPDVVEDEFLDAMSDVEPNRTGSSRYHLNRTEQLFGYA